jgi:lipid A 3-O-deacylase
VSSITFVAWLVLCSSSSETIAPNSIVPAARSDTSSDLVAIAQRPFHFEPVNQSESRVSFGAISDQDPDALTTSSMPVADYGRDGDRHWMIRAGGGSTFRSDHFGQLGVGLMYFIAEDVSINLELNGVGFRQENEDALGLNFSLLLRWHFYNNDDRTFSLYGEGGAGLLLTTSDVPHDGSSFNFTPQLGGGLSFAVGDDARLYAGLRWFHVSNANLYEANPGRDHAMVYAELSFPF